MFSLWSYSLVSGKGKEEQRMEWPGKEKILKFQDTILLKLGLWTTPMLGKVLKD